MSVPRRVRKLNFIYEAQGGVASHVLTRIDRGDRIEDIAADLTDACGELIPVRTLYFWIRDWRPKKSEVAA